MVLSIIQSCLVTLSFVSVAAKSIPINILVSVWLCLQFIILVSIYQVFVYQQHDMLDFCVGIISVYLPLKTTEVQSSSNDMFLGKWEHEQTFKESSRRQKAANNNCVFDASPFSHIVAIAVSQVKSQQPSITFAGAGPEKLVSASIRLDVTVTRSCQRSN